MSSEKSTVAALDEGSLAERLCRIGIIAFVLFFAGARLFRGVDFTDEAYYTTVALRFAMGDKPFVDQILVHQTAFLLFTPLVWLFHWLTGGTQGLVLFLRVMSLGFSISVAAVVYRVLRRTVDKNIALVASLLCVAFSGEWVTLCYNNLGALFLLVALMLLFRAASNDSARPPFAIMALAGVASGLSVIAYPTMLLPVAVALGVAIAYLASARARLLSAFAGGFFLGTLPVLIAALGAGWTNLLAFATATGRVSSNVGQGGGMEKLVWMLKCSWYIFFRDQMAQAGTVLIAGLGFLFRRSPLRLVLAGIVLVSLIWIRAEYWGAGFRFLIRLCLWSPLLFLVLKERFPLLPRLFWCVCFPSLVAGFTTAWTSANGAVNAGVGLVPAAVVTTLMLGLLIKEAFAAYRSWAFAPSIAVMFSVLLALLVLQRDFIYGEGNPVHLTARVKKGPYWGLTTTPDKAGLCHSLVEDLARLGGEDRILFYDFFTGGYLFTSRRPASNTTLEYSPTRSGVMGYIRDPRHWPGTVFEMCRIDGFTGTIVPARYSVDDPLKAFVESHYQLLYENGYYRVYGLRVADSREVQSIMAGKRSQALLKVAPNDAAQASLESPRSPY